MAQTVKVELIDDMDGKSEASESITYAFDGVTYEIDLNEKHAQQLRDKLAPFINASRKVKAVRASKSSRNGAAPNAREVREWARENGLEVPDRGRIPREIQERYAAR